MPPDRPRRAALPRGLVLILLLSLGSCAKLARCEMDKVRADVLDYEKQTKPLRAEERKLKQRIDELEGKIFTNQKAGVDLLRAVLVRATTDFADKLSKIPIRSRLIRPHHDRKVRAYIKLAAAYQKLMHAYPAADFDAIRAGLAERERAMRELAAAELKLRRLLRKYKARRR